MSRTIGAAEFKATCLRVIKQMNQDREPVVVTRHDDPFEPAADPAEWSAQR